MPQVLPGQKEGSGQLADLPPAPGLPGSGAEGRQAPDGAQRPDRPRRERLKKPRKPKGPKRGSGPPGQGQLPPGFVPEPEGGEASTSDVIPAVPGPTGSAPARAADLALLHMLTSHTLWP